MALELEGTLRQKLGVQSGMSARGNWAKQEFILEFPDGNFTSQACFTAFGQDKVAELDKYQVGDRIRVSFNIRGREYNGRWYTDLQIWRIAPAGEASPAASVPSAPAAPVASAPANAPQAPYVAAPAASAPAFDAPAPTLDDMPADDSGDDLPF
ncbi:MAG: DUF3127 domain-containing protein [Bacteroidales bacterium]|nr:DUF3127 domain-containing protein [Bacteroidales bacterium]